MDKDEEIEKMTQKVKERDRLKGRWKIQRQIDETQTGGNWKSALRYSNECRKAKKKL